MKNLELTMDITKQYIHSYELLQLEYIDNQLLFSPTIRQFYYDCHISKH